MARSEQGVDPGSKFGSLAKTTRPSLVGVLPRDRLFALLDQGRHSSVTWITGPPGSGKTTLVSSYVENRAWPCLWYQLDESDSDVATFFYYLRSAAAQFGKGKTAGLSLFTAEYHDGIAAFTRRFFQALFARMRPPFAIVFDGYHEVASHSALHDVMRDALSEVPAGGHVFIISRSDPAASLVRLRANRTLEVLGWDELRLTRAESDAMVKLRGRDLPEPALARLFERTQGWAAGLVLMLEQTKGSAVAADVHDLTSPQLVFDYLAGEVLQKADASTRELLLKTSFLSLMTAQMAEELTGQSNAAAILSELHANNYFVALRRTSPQLVYQVHPLFRDFLRSHVRGAFERKTLEDLQRASAILLEKAGQLEDAIRVLCDIPDWALLVQTVNTHAASLVESGRGETLAQWLEAMPPDILHRKPWALYWLGASRLAYAPRESRQLYEQAFMQFGSENPVDVKGQLLACSGAIDAILFEWDDFALLDKWIESLDAVLKTLSGFPSKGLEARVSCSMFVALMMRQPEHPDLEQWRDRAYTLSQTQPDPNLRISVEVVVATGFLYAGHFPKAMTVIESIRELARSADVSPLAQTTLCNVESMYYMLSGAYEPCLKAVRDGLEIAHSTGVHIWSYQLLANGAAGALGAADLDMAQKFLQQMETHPQRPGRFGLCFFHYFSAWDAMLRNDKLRAYQQQKMALRMAIEVGCPFWEVLCRLASAQVLYACKEEARAGVQLRQVRDLVHKKLVRNRLIEFTTLFGYAQIAIEHGRLRSGLRALGYALALGRRSGYSHVLWWRPEAVSRLFVQALQANIEVDYVRGLIKTRGLIPDASSLGTSGWPWAYQVFTLGQFKVLKDEKALDVGSKAQRRPMEMLKVLIAYGGHEVTEDRITDALWPRIDGDSAHHSFTTTLHRLRKLLGQDKALVLREGKLSLDRRYWWVDIWAFEHTAEELRSGPKGLHDSFVPEQVATLTERLFSVYRGGFMAGEMDDPSYFATRDRVRNKFVRTVSEIGRFWEQSGKWEAAAACYERGLEVDPAAEGLYRRLMICYQEHGRRAEAIEVYHRCSKTLCAAFKIEPAAETNAVYEQLLKVPQ
jgi:LuxR family maltose regulon positive regulatory protein